MNLSREFKPLIVDLLPNLVDILLPASSLGRFISRPNEPRINVSEIIGLGGTPLSVHLRSSSKHVELN